MVVTYLAINLKKLLFVLSVFHWRVKCAELKTLSAKSAGSSSVPVNIRSAPSVYSAKKKNKSHQDRKFNSNRKLSLVGPY